MKASAAVTIYAPIDQVFDFIANIENNDQWINGVTEPAWTSVSVMETGATFQSMYTYGGKTHEIAYEITALETPRLMATRSTSGPFPFDSEDKNKTVHMFASSCLTTISLAFRTIGLQTKREGLCYVHQLTESCRFECRVVWTAAAKVSRLGPV